MDIFKLKKPKSKKRSLLNLKSLLIPVIAMGAVIIFFLSYNTYLVDHSLEDLRFALDQTARAQNIAEMERISLLLDDVLINEMSSFKMNSVAVTKLEFARNVVSRGGVKDQINDIEFLLARLVKAKEKKRGVLFLALDRMNNDIQNAIRFIGKELPAGALRPDLFKPAAKIDLSLFETAKKYEENWQFKEAISAYEEFMRKYSTYPQLRLVKLHLASVYFKSGNYREAQRLYEKLIEESPQTDEARVASILLEKVKDRIQKQTEKEKLNTAISQLIRSASTQKDYTELDLVDSYLAKLDKETKDLVVYVMSGAETGARVGEGEVDLSLIDKAKKLEKDWKLDQAQAIYEAFIAKYPTYKDLASVKFILAGTYLKSMQYKKAMECYEGIIANYPSSKEADLSKKLILKTKEIISVSQKRQSLVDKISKLKAGVELAQSYYDLGMVDIYIFDLEAAESAFKKVIELTPSGADISKRAEFMLGWVYKFGAKYEKGVAVFSNFVEKHPQDPLTIDSTYHIADAYYKSGKYEEAAKAYEGLSDKFQDSSLAEIALLQAGYTYLYNLHDPLRASAAFKKLKARHPDADSAGYISNTLMPTTERSYRDYGFILLKENRLEEAKEAFENAITIDSQDAWSHCGLGTTYVLLNSLDEGIEFMSNGLKKVRDEYTYAALGFAYDEKGEYLKAIEEYKRSIAKNPDYLVARYNLGRDYIMVGWYDSAIQELKETLRIAPNFAEGHNNLGSAYWYNGQIVDAEFEFKAAISSNPDLVEAQYNLGILYETAGKHRKAASHFKNALIITPDLESAKWHLERVQAEMKR